MRLSFDWDHENLKRALDSFSQIVRAFPENKAELRKTRKGFHAIFHDLDITEEESYVLRALWGDDLKRIEIDRQKPKQQPKQVLWTEKAGFKTFIIMEWKGLTKKEGTWKPIG